MDRALPSRRPERRPSGHQQWRDLLFLHWPVSPALLRKLVPRELEIDCFDGQAFVGVVPFEMFGVRSAWWPRWAAFAFPETNVRTYVHVAGRDPGVFFFSLDAASWLAVRAARLGWGLPYHHARMQVVRRDGEIAYRLERRAPDRAELLLRYGVEEPIGPAQPGSLDHFLIERYLLHVPRGPRIYTGQVHHRPYPLARARLLELRQSLLRAAGFGEPSGEPLVHYASGVDVEIFGLRPAVAQGSR